MSRFPSRTLLLLGGLLLATPASAHQYEAGDLTIVHPWARATIGTQTIGAAYATIRNRGKEPDQLVEVQTGEAKSASLHSTTITPEGVAKMRPVDALAIPPGGEAKLAPGGLHIMLTGLQEPLMEGTSFPMTFVFRHAGKVPVEVMVEGARAGGAAPDDEAKMDHAM